MTTVAAIGVSGLAAAGLTALTAARRHAWKDRGITTRIPYPVLWSIQAAAALTVAALVGSRIGAAQAVAAAAATWLAVLAVATDLSCQRVPREIPHPVTGIGLAAACVANPGSYGWLSLAVGLAGVVGPTLIARAMIPRAIGFSDVRLLWAWTASLSWWVGHVPLMWALIGACLIQLPVHIAARILNRATAPASHTTASRAQPGMRPRQALPFAPALTVTFAAAAAYTTVTGVGVCHAWAPAGGC